MKLAIFVEGQTEKDALPEFFRRWLDSQLPGKRIAIHAVELSGAGGYLRQFAKRVRIALGDSQVVGAVGLIDLYGSSLSYPDGTTQARYQWAKRELEKQVNDIRFRQHFAVHETEAWLLSEPNIFPGGVAQILQNLDKPENVNFQNPPSVRLKQIYQQQLGKKYGKPLEGSRLFARLDPELAARKCPHLRLLLKDLLDMTQGVN